MGWIDPSVNDAIRVSLLALIPACTAFICAYIRYKVRKLDMPNGTLDERLNNIEAQMGHVARHVARHMMHHPSDPPDASPG